MKKLMFVFTVASLVLSSVIGVSAGELPADATNIRSDSIKIFRNVSGAVTTSGTAFVLQDANTDSNVLIGTDFGRESSLGLDVTTTTSDDVSTFIGCQVQDSCLDDGLCKIVTWGPALCRWAGATDNTDSRMALVGTTAIAGQLGSGTNAGLTMSLSIIPGENDTEFNGQNDGELRWIWIDPGRD